VSQNKKPAPFQPHYN